MREHIISEIQRLALADNGKAPGRLAFTAATGITMGKWCGVYWARWSEALADAGCSANSMQPRLNSDDIIVQVAILCRQLGRMPTSSDMKLKSNQHSDFPSEKTVYNHFDNIAGVRSALRRLAETPEYADLIGMIPTETKNTNSTSTKSREGLVYLLKSGAHYKIGRSDNLERRVKQIAISLPERVNLIHAIRTDDPVGIEAYWHNRFAERRANGEWFNLSAGDLKAFMKRKFQ